MTTTASDPVGVTIREAEPADLIAIVRIEQSSFSQPWPFQAFQNFVGTPGFLVAASGGDVIGYVVSDTARPWGTEVGHIKDIAVHPEYRRRGIGKRLLERALTVLLVEGVTRVKLEVRASNERAIALYEQYGFSPKHRVPRYYDDGEDAIVYVTDLDDAGTR